MINPAQIIGLYPPSRRLYVKYSSDVARFILQDDFALSLRDPTCIPVVDETNILGEALQVAVQANFRGGSEDRIEELSAALRACFPWQPGLLACRRYRGLPQVNSSGVGTITTDQLHPSGREGPKNPGNAGLTLERLGDSKPWSPDATPSESPWA